ncbi:type II toxin-antitoxin system VapB family antitoxin [Belliella kenyensis]|uniref:Type II toxin-antitoxin system VapB family antitoxin n=1 Tax=Belliella kenyensis TaxID=1472724 RepID=A0ABV8ERF2_9BACT|nr:type II toxin-antitoxin system VapB family antitoxin [Belliella kenyensis]MCH7402107.1 type II toxin-antitoxin system VapB family antitoxin [Belliella kenyensis]MDN3601549.1 type II toxin-antitoxin system VapB family antitoxin [Belliella kenyensis]
MKVTAIISKELIEEAMELSKADTITETLKVALISYIRSQKVKQIGASIVSEPLEFKYSAQELRDLNRR